MRESDSTFQSERKREREKERQREPRPQTDDEPRKSLDIGELKHFIALTKRTDAARLQTC